MSDNIYTIVGERIALGPMQRELIPRYHKWRNDLWIQRTYGNSLEPKLLEDQERWFDGLSDSDAIWFTIFELETGDAIGATDLFQIEREHGLAWWGMMIGEADARGKGYAAEVARLMLDYAFTALNLHVVTLAVDEFNTAARRAYERAGFKETGRMREATYVAGTRYDRIVMDCLASEFNSPVLRALLAPEVDE
jgi:diamine N-acetyltransferase